MSRPKKVCVVGSGNWGSAISILIGENASRHAHLHDTVTMYVYEEVINGRNLTDIINEDHENIKYLPGYKLPPNILAIPDVVLAAKDADAIIFVVPQQFIRKVCATLLGKIKPTAAAVSLIKGFDVADDGGIELISSVIHRLLRINVSVLMGANIASEVAAGHFTEAALGCANKQVAPLWQDIFSTENYRVCVTEDMEAVEVYSGLTSVVSTGVGFVDGLDQGANTKAAIIRLGIREMIKFVDVFYPGARLATFFESCGVGDLVATCFGGRSRRMGEMFVRTGTDLELLEIEHLNGQKLPGPATAAAANCMLKGRSMEMRFPMITAIHLICKGEMKPEQLLEAMKTHPESTLVLHNTSF